MTFQKYLESKGYKSGDKIPKAQAQQLYSSWNKLSDELLLKQLEKTPKDERTTNELAAGIADILRAGEAANIGFNPAKIQEAQKAVQRGNIDAMRDSIEYFSGRYEAKLGEQDKEKKTPIQFEDGTKGLIGETTGTRYTSSGVPIPETSMNTTTYNMSMLKSGVPPEEVGRMAIPTSTETQFNPEAYQKSIVETDVTALQEKESAFIRAKKLYDEGKYVEAVAAVNAAGGKGLMGMATIDDLPSLFGERTETNPPTIPSRQLRPPLGEILGQ